MGNSDESAEARAEALARRAEEAAARAEERRAAAALAQASQASEDPPWVAATAAYVWDPLGDDPNANHDDGRAHPEEDAIADREARHEAKMEAWRARAERLTGEGKVYAAMKAVSHMEWHGHRIEAP
jgi:hypothetical protein